ncbi:MAG: ABC transporter permease subunit [Gammaproteobacteria bacterium]|nr:ABC transporter permease subunit [Gammaproteobacteria bacterium]
MIDAILSSAFIEDFITLAKPAAFNLYFALASIPLGFPFAVLLALGKASRSRWKSLVSKAYIYAFRGSPLFIQFFMFYSIMLALNKPMWKPLGIDDVVLHPLFLGPFVLMLNTSAYAAEIFYGALKTVPKGEVEAALAVGMNKWAVFKSVTWPNMLRLSWPAYTNEMVFLFHATTVVYFTLPVINEQKDLMNKAGELFEKDYNVFLHFSVAAFYFVAISIVIFWLANIIQKRLNRHIKTDVKPLSFKPKYLR